jgi:HlyD family secretion protein
MKKWTVIGVFALLIIGSAAWYWKRHDEGAVQYQTATVTRGDLTQLVTATGQLNPVTNVQVGCQISGTISQLFVDYNSPVTNGQVVAQIDPGTYQANFHQAEADLANAKAALELAAVNAKRSGELLVEKLIPQSDYDQAEANLHQAQATVQVKEAAAEKARVDLERCTIYSPVDGVVISRSVDVGQTVAASFNAPVLFQIANDLSKMQIDANVAEADIGNVEAGEKVNFTVDAFPNRTFHGTVVQVRNAPTTVQNVVTYDTVIGVSNPDLKLKPGMTANASIILETRDNALRIPNAALRFHPLEATDANGATRPASNGNGGKGRGSKTKGEHTHMRTVYVLDSNNNPKPVDIKTGISDGIYTEVIDGLKEGDAIITGSLSLGGARRGGSSPFGGGFRRF